MTIPDYEIGMTICKCKGGRIELGPLAKGTRNKVVVPIKCPRSCIPVGIAHTHPGGPVSLSRADKKALVKNKLEIGCVSDEKQTRCFKVKKK